MFQWCYFRDHRVTVGCLQTDWATLSRQQETLEILMHLNIYSLGTLSHQFNQCSTVSVRLQAVWVQNNRSLQGHFHSFHLTLSQTAARFWKLLSSCLKISWSARLNYWVFKHLFLNNLFLYVERCINPNFVADFWVLIKHSPANTDFSLKNNFV